jgi:hypothetical protein
MKMPPPPRRVSSHLVHASCAAVVFFLAVAGGGGGGGGVLGAPPLGDDPEPVGGTRYFSWSSAFDGSGRRSGPSDAGPFGRDDKMMRDAGASSAGLPHPKDRALVMRMCKKKGAMCRTPVKPPVKPPTQAPAVAGVCGAGLSTCSNSSFIGCGGPCLCARDTAGAPQCVDPTTSSTLCSDICASNSDCPAGEACILSEASCCANSTCTPLCVV